MLESKTFKIGFCFQYAFAIASLITTVAYFVSGSSFPTSNLQINLWVIALSLVTISLSSVSAGVWLSSRTENKKQELNNAFAQSLRESLSRITDAKSVADIHVELSSLQDLYSEKVSILGGDDLFEFGGVSILCILDRLNFSTGGLALDNDANDYIRQQSIALISRLISKSIAADAAISAESKRRTGVTRILQTVSLSIPLVVLLFSLGLKMYYMLINLF